MHRNAKQDVRILTTLSRWPQIIQFCIKDYEAALDSGIEYRIVVESTEDEFALSNEIELLLKSQILNLLLVQSTLKPMVQFLMIKRSPSISFQVSRYQTLHSYGQTTLV